MDILYEVKYIIAETKGVKMSQLMENTAFADDLGFDSIDMFELAMELEKKIDVNISVADMESIRTIGDAVKYLERQGVPNDSRDTEDIQPEGSFNLDDQDKYREILQKVMGHKDFGTRNPLDIGMELGYTQDEIFRVLSIQGTEDSVQEQKEYFVLHNGYVVSVNLINRKVSLVKKLNENCEAKIKYGILVWNDSEDGFSLGVKSLFWENLNTGEKGEFTLPKDQEKQESPWLRIDKSIDRFFVLEDGILIKSNCDFYKVYYTGKVIKKKLDYFYSADVVAEKNHKIYVASRLRVWSMNSDLNNVEIICKYDSDENKTILALEKDGNDIFYHVFDESSLWHSYYRKYNTTGERVPEDPFLSGDFTDAVGYVSNPVEILSTKNYKAYSNAIYKRTSGKAVWGSSENISFIYQASAIYDKDIILGCVSRLWDKNQLGITLFDLSKRNTPVFLPLESEA